MELAHLILAADDGGFLYCKVCSAPFRLTESRVMRAVKSPGAGDQETPRLCWVCAHLYLSANSKPACACTQYGKCHKCSMAGVC